MKKIFTSLLLITAVALNIHSEETSVVYNWHSDFTVGSENGKPQTTIYGMKTDADGAAYTLSQYGSHSTSPNDGLEASFMGESFVGAPYSVNTSYCFNLSLVKHDFEGNVKWKVYTCGGDISVSGSAFTPTSDGGAFLALKCRHSDKNNYEANGESEKDVILRIVGADGQPKVVTYNGIIDGTYRWIYQPVFVKINANGEVTNVIKQSCDISAAPAATTYSWGTSNGFDFNQACADNEGNIYVIGEVRRNLTIADNDASVVIPTRNTDSWNGDTQQASGGAFLLKLDNNMKPLGIICPEGVSAEDKFNDIIFANNSLYLLGMQKGVEDNGILNFGGKSINVRSVKSLINAKVNPSDLSVSWFSITYGSVQNSKNTFYTKPKLLLSTNKKYLYVSGAVQGSIEVGGNPIDISTSKVYNKFIARFDETTGKCDKANIDISTGIAVYINSLAEYNNNIYAFGYDWTAGREYKATLDSFDEDLNPVSQYGLITGSAAISTAGLVNKENTFLVGARNFKGQDAKFNGTSEISNSTTQWYAILASFTIGSLHTGVNTIDQASGVKIYGGERKLTVISDKSITLYVYDVTGRMVAKVNAQGGTTTVELPAGLYIVNNRKVLIK